jgi:hypothetical protein
LETANSLLYGLPLRDQIEVNTLGNEITTQRLIIESAQGQNFAAITTLQNWHRNDRLAATLAVVNSTQIGHTPTCDHVFCYRHAPDTSATLDSSIEGAVAPKQKPLNLVLLVPVPGHTGRQSNPILNPCLSL